MEIQFNVINLKLGRCVSQVHFARHILKKYTSKKYALAKSHLD